MTADISAMTREAILARHAELSDAIRRTPTVTLGSDRLRALTGAAELVAKLELFQHTGTFKARGALSNARAIPADRRAAGITAASAGNHAIAAAWAARMAGLSARVVMQDTANPYRIALARAEGADVILKAPGAPTFAEAERLVAEEGRTFLHPFEGLNTSLGSAGVGVELVEDAGPLDAVVVACGGGGLISGVAAAVRLMSPGTEVWGVEPEGADSMTRSLDAGHPVTLERTATIADSLAPPMALPFGFALCQAHLAGTVRVSDDQICAAMVRMAEEAMAVEPAAAAPLAALCGPLRDHLEGKRVAIVVCGANIDSATLGTLLERGRAVIAGQEDAQ